MRKGFLVPAAACVMILSGCSDADRASALESRMEAQSALIEALDQKVAELSKKVDQADKMAYSAFSKASSLEQIEQNRYTTQLDPAEKSVYSVITTVGMILVSVESVRPHADGVEVRLSVGNATSATLSNADFSVTYGSREPKQLEDAKDFEQLKASMDTYEAWHKSLQSRSVSLNKNFAPGYWTAATLQLPGISQEKLGFMKISINPQSIRLNTSR